MECAVTTYHHFRLFRVNPLNNKLIKFYSTILVTKQECYQIYIIDYNNIHRTVSADLSSPPGVPVTRLQPPLMPSVPRTRGVRPAVSASCVLSQEVMAWARGRRRCTYHPNIQYNRIYFSLSGYQPSNHICY